MKVKFLLNKGRIESRLFNYYLKFVKKLEYYIGI